MKVISIDTKRKMFNLKNNVKYFFLLTIISATLFAGVANAGTLKTKNYSIKIKANCERQPICINYIYVLKNLKRGKSINLPGKAIYTQGVDEYTPGRLIRHEFRNNQYLYRITADNKLQVLKSGKLILQEQGTLK